MRERTGKGTRLQEKFEKEVPASAGEVLSNPNKNNT